MRVLIDSELERYPLYNDFKKLIEESGYIDKVTKLPEKEDYFISYLEKLWDFLKIELDPKVKSYAICEIYSFKGTTKIFDLLGKWFKYLQVKDWNLSEENVLDVTIDVEYNGTNPQLLTKLIREYFMFLLFFTELGLVYDTFHHIIDIVNKRELKYHLYPWINVNIEIV